MVQKSFEAALVELEEIVHRLENGDLSLEQTLSLYERGQHLARQCQERLDQAELHITELANGTQESL